MSYLVEYSPVMKHYLKLEFIDNPYPINLCLTSAFPVDLHLHLIATKSFFLRANIPRSNFNFQDFQFNFLFPYKHTKIFLNPCRQ